jgi:hypothetical protein
MFKTAMEEKMFSEAVFPVKVVNRVACRFSISKRTGLSGGHSGGTRPSSANVSGLGAGDLGPLSDSGSDVGFCQLTPETVDASFDMASLCYIHCPKFLEELVDCVSEFRQYMGSVATSIKTSAMEVAMGMVGGGAGRGGGPGDKDVYAEGSSVTSLARQSSLGDITNTILLQDRDRDRNISVVFSADSSPERDVARDTSGSAKGGTNVVLSARMETPIIVIPRKPNSPQVGILSVRKAM